MNWRTDFAGALKVRWAGGLRNMHQSGQRTGLSTTRCFFVAVGDLDFRESTSLQPEGRQKQIANIFKENE